MIKNLTRAFICITFPYEIIKEITRIQEIVQKQNFTGKITEPENLHLTLKFLGEISEENIKKVKSALSHIKFNQFKAHLHTTGTFSVRKNPKIAWIKIAGKEIHELQKQIDSILSPEFKKEERFMSHLTIARIKYVKDKENFKKYIENIKPKPLEFSVSSFKLMSSELKPLGPVYSILEEYPSIS